MTRWALSGDFVNCRQISGVLQWEHDKINIANDECYAAKLSMNSIKYWITKYPMVQYWTLCKGIINGRYEMLCDKVSNGTVSNIK